MPTPIKLLLSAIVILVAVAVFFHQQSIGQVGTKYAALFLGIFVAITLWIFPEVRGNEAGPRDSQS